MNITVSQPAFSEMFKYLICLTSFDDIIDICGEVILSNRGREYNNGNETKEKFHEGNPMEL